MTVRIVNLPNTVNWINVDHIVDLVPEYDVTNKKIIATYVRITDGQVIEIAGYTPRQIIAFLNGPDGDGIA